MSKEFERRRKLTFSQAEGLVALPSQLKPGVLSSGLRARIWRSLHASMSYTSSQKYFLADPWRTMLYDFHVEVLHARADTFDPTARQWLDSLGDMITGDAKYSTVFDFLTWILRRPNVPAGLAARLQADFDAEQAAYRIFGGDTIVPVGTEAEGATIGTAFADLEQTEFHGARTHLKKAMDYLSQGKPSDSIRESIHAVEGVARAIDDKASTLNDALRRLVNAGELDKPLSLALDKLYAWTSNEEGVRHALVFENVADVDDADAQFMAGACASFVSYLINRARIGKLI